MAVAPPIWGVNSWNKVNTMIGTQTLYDWVAKKVGEPHFWGRYIGGITPPLDLAEANLLHTNGCKILLIYNKLTEAMVSATGTAGFNAGKDAADDAIKRAQNPLKVPEEDTIWIYANIEGGWKVSSDWILGWWQKMYDSSYGGVGGLYCNPVWTAHWKSNFVKAYCAAVASTSIPNVTNLSYLYSQLDPNGRVAGCAADPSTLPFTPANPPCHPGGSVIWQYAINCYKGILPPLNQGIIDMDLANQRGINSMWA
jgi:hypothetical protein